MSKKILTLLLILLVTGLMTWAAGGKEEAEIEAPAAKIGEYGEAPMLAKMVASGELPPVEERLPKNPKVVEMIESIGRYGGDLVAFATKEGIFNEDLQGMWGSSLFRSPRDGVGVEPDLAEGYEINEDKTAITVFLREGLKWSDGHPLTSEDIRFTFEDMHFNPSVATWGSWGIDAIEVIDEYTAKFINNEGLGINLLQMASWWGGYVGTYHPAHYLKQWHIDYNADADKLAKEEGFEHWYEAMRDHFWWTPLKDVNKPQIEPWDVAEHSTTAKLFVRNPYFWRVDEAGNQLPYIDRVRVQIVNPEIYQLKVTGGAASLAYYHADFANLPLYKTSEDEGEYKVILHPGVMGANIKLIMNQNHPDPELRSIYNNLKFRQALSVAIDRDEVNEVIYQGLGVPRQCAPLKTVSYYKEGWQEHYAQYDPDLAEQLLDEIGLDKKDSAGYRRKADGKTLSLVIEYTDDRYTAELELVKEYWDDVGFKTIIKLQDMGLMDQRMGSSEYFAWVHPNPFQPWCDERNMFQRGWVWAGEAGQASQWMAWLSSKMAAAEEELGEGVSLPPDWRRLKTAKDDELEGEEPPMYWIEKEELLNVWSQTEMGSPEYRELGQEYLDFWVNRLTRIGVVGEIPNIMIAKNKLGNVLTPGWVSGAPVDHEYVQTWMDQLYWKE